MVFIFSKAEASGTFSILFYFLGGGVGGWVKGSRDGLFWKRREGEWSRTASPFFWRVAGGVMRSTRLVLTTAAITIDQGQVIVDRMRR